MDGLDRTRESLVSVVITTHNRARLLALAMRSVLEQTYRHLELLVVDDASTDDTGETVGRLADGRVRYLRHAECRGGSAARNTGILNASGDFIAFLDDDDEWFPRKLELQMERFRANPRAGAVYTGLLHVELETGRTVNARVARKRGYLFDDLMVANVVGTPSTVVVRREIFDRGGLFDETIQALEDLDMWRRMGGTCYFDFVREPLLRYGLHGHERVTVDYGKMAHGFEAQLEKFADEFARRDKARSVCHYWIGLYYIRDDPKRARQALLRAVAAYPLRPNPYPWLALTCCGKTGLRALDLFERYPWRRYTYLRGWLKSRFYGVNHRRAQAHA
ncbi:MAG: glycosyltransferase family A protein [Actinomycetota bacterium]